MKSMTGYGVFRLENKNLMIEVSIRSVNGRYLETRFHSPRLYYAFESELKKKLAATIQRGTVDIYVSRKLKSTVIATRVVGNSILGLEYLKAFKKLSTDLGLKDAIRLEQITKMPEVIQVEENDKIHLNEAALLKKAFEAALKKIEIERLREGVALKKDLMKNLKDLQRHMLKISKLREEANKTLQERFETRIKLKLSKELANTPIDSQRISQEIVMQLEKADINEEITRLSEHLKNFEKLIEASLVEGKKLDFYTQELLREVNTIGSKSQVSGITEAVVESKTLIERIREQVQNIE